MKDTLNKEDKEYREKIITKMLQRRYTYQEIGDICGITKQRVHAIAKKNKLTNKQVGIEIQEKNWDVVSNLYQHCTIMKAKIGGDIDKIGSHMIDFEDPVQTYTYFMSAYVVYNDILNRFKDIIKVVAPKKEINKKLKKENEK